MNQPSSSTRLLRYLSTTAALGGLAQGAVVYTSFETVLADTSSTAANLNDTLAAIRFDGTSITLNHTSAGGALSISADDIQPDLTSTTGALKTDQGGRLTGSPYLQTASVLAYGDAITAGFTAATAKQTFTGSATDQYIGVSAPGNYLGWVRFSYSADGATVTVHDAAFQSEAGASILAGTLVPEPSSMGLLGLAGGLASLRRRRKAA